MGCSSCSTTTTENGTPAGCKSNGTCGTGGCNKLNVYNWLADMTLPEGHKPFDIVEVRFKGSRKEFYKNVNNLELHVGDFVAVEGNPGHDIGEVSMVGELVRFQLRKKNVQEDAIEIKSLYRIARPVDLDKWNEVKALEFNTMHTSRTIALELKLKMKLSDVEFQGDGKKATFFYTADERVDFRELIKRLADEFKVRIEMRQIGMRQEASRLGGIGSCGRELCCSTWLTDFKIVSTSAARYQNLSLNPLKLAGQCGKLKCCLNFELDTYMDAIRDIPESNIKLLTGKGTLVHRKTDIFKRIMWYNLLPEIRDPEERPQFVPENWMPISVDRVKEIIELNKSGQKPEDAGMMEFEDEIDDTDYKDVVGQDSLTRMDRTKKKKKKKKGGAEDVKSPVAPIARQSLPPRPQPQQRPNPKGGKQESPSPQPRVEAPKLDVQKPDQPRQQQSNLPPRQKVNPPQQNQPASKPVEKTSSNNPQPTNRPERKAPEQNPSETKAIQPNPAPQQGNRPQRQAPNAPAQQQAPKPASAPENTKVEPSNPGSANNAQNTNRPERKRPEGNDASTNSGTQNPSNQSTGTTPPSNQNPAPANQETPRGNRPPRQFNRDNENPSS